MDLGLLGEIDLSWNFVSGLLSIIMIDLILAGDNAVVIAMAVRSLPRKQQMQGIVFGSGAAILLRVTLTFFAAQLLAISLIKLFGGALILWIAVKLFVGGVPQDKFQKEAATFGQAVRIIVIADLVMSMDNVLAVAGASHGNLSLLLFGLGLSIPLVVGTSTLLSRLMDKYPVIIYLGAAVLGKVAGEMVITDPFVARTLHPGHFLEYALQGSLAIGVIAIGSLWIRWRILKEGKAVLVRQEDLPFAVLSEDSRRIEEPREAE